jgi:hypothetical protein
MTEDARVSEHTGLRLAELAYVLILAAGIWLAAAQVPRLKLAAGRTAPAGVALALGGLLLIIATHWGHYN